MDKERPSETDEPGPLKLSMFVDAYAGWQTNGTGTLALWTGMLTLNVKPIPSKRYLVVGWENTGTTGCGACSTARFFCALGAVGFAEATLSVYSSQRALDDGSLH